MDAWLLPTALGGLSLAVHWWYNSRHSVPLPPGPKGHPIFGSAADVANAESSWAKFAEYADQYGPLVSIRMFHRYIIILSDPGLVTELFEKRAANYSDKRPNGMAKLTGWDKDIFFMSYGPLLKKYRTMLNRALNNRISLDYIPLQQREVQRLAASIAVRIAYGHKVESDEDEFVRTAEEDMAGFSETLRPWNWGVNIIPFLRYLPLRFPIFPFQRRALELKRIHTAHCERPFKFVMDQMALGTAEDSFTSKLLQDENGLSVDDETKAHIKSIASSLYAAGSDTTVSGVQSFFLAMALYPEVQDRAQAEIDAYIKEHYPTEASHIMISPADRPNLPYTSALVREVLRWHPIVPVVAHRSGQDDDNYVASQGKTYRIPAGTLILVNVWKIMHNPEVYKQPSRFMPERFLVENPPPEPENYVFGFGRRICPGLHIAQQSMWTSISNLLANFTITKAKDESGAEIIPEEQYSDVIISHPSPFPCSITPREFRREWLEGNTE